MCEILTIYINKSWPNRIENIKLIRKDTLNYYLHTIVRVGTVQIVRRFY